MSGLLWLRIFFHLRLNPILGPMIKILGYMLKDMATFLGIYGIVLIIFASIGMIIFDVE